MGTHLNRHKTYYQQHPMGDGVHFRPSTLTVGELIAQLQQFDPSLPVIYRMPSTGCFGAEVCQALDGAQHETLEAKTIHNPATVFFDEEEGVEKPQEAYDDELPAWNGVVIA
jgi:hypothetical protein